MSRIVEKRTRVSLIRWLGAKHLLFYECITNTLRTHYKRKQVDHLISSRVGTPRREAQLQSPSLTALISAPDRARASRVLRRIANARCIDVRIEKHNGRVQQPL